MHIFSLLQAIHLYKVRQTNKLGVPQGSVLGPLSVDNAVHSIRKHGMDYHFYAFVPEMESNGKY